MSDQRSLLLLCCLILSLAGCSDETATPPVDSGQDTLKPDAPMPDAPQPDQELPDAAVPDQALPDAPVPDLPAPTCSDKLKNGAETDIDCGGGTCPKCGTAKACKACTDCSNGYCGAGKCTAAASCAAIKKACTGATDGTYALVGTGGPISAYCEMTFLGGGWLAIYNMMKLPSTTTGAATMYTSITNRAAMSAPVKPDSSSKSVYTSGIPLKDYTEVVYGWAASSSAAVTRYGTYKKTGGLASDCYVAKTCGNNVAMASFSIMPQKITRTLYTGNSPGYPHVGIGWTGQQILWGYDKNQSSYGPWANWNSSACCYSGNTAEAAKAGWRYVIYIR